LHSHFSNEHFSAAFAFAKRMQNAGRAARVIDQSPTATKPAQALRHLSRLLHQARQQILADRIAQQNCALLSLADGHATAQLPKPDCPPQRHANRLHDPAPDKPANDQSPGQFAADIHFKPRTPADTNDPKDPDLRTFR
jgi:hypothetical protein